MYYDKFLKKWRKRPDTVTKFDPKALRRAIKKCDENIRIFQEAIEKEKLTKTRFQRLLKEAVEG